jgi:hypothetical protein
MDVTLQVLSVVAVVSSVLVLAWQSREVAHATRVAANTSVSGVMTDAAANMRSVFEALLTYPDLRKFVTEGAPLPAAPLDRSRAQTMCEMFCDAMEGSLETAAQVPGGEKVLGGWPDWATWVLASSPGCSEHVRLHPIWYPRLTELQRPGTTRTQSRT